MVTQNDILDAYGRPARLGLPSRGTSDNGNGKVISKAYANFVSAVFGVSADPVFRATEPFENHAWVYACAMAIATNLAQAPFQIMRETEKASQVRVTRMKALGRPWVGPPAGRGRRAVERHMTRAANPMRFRGLRSKALELDETHPLMNVFKRPNPLMSQGQLWQGTSLWQTMRGQCFWILLSEEGKRIAPGDIPGQIWLGNPDLIEPLYKENRLVAWDYRVPRGAGYFREGERVSLLPHEVIRFYLLHPSDPARAISPLTAAAMGITMDMLAGAHNKAVLENGADPGGILMHKEGYDEEEVQKQVKQFEQRHKGTQNRRKIGWLTGGWEYVPTGMTPEDMEWFEQRQWDRDEVLAVTRTPKSILSITDGLNYATQLSQDWNFWDKNLLPQIRYFEDVLDGTLFFTETDNVMGMFDLSGVDALRQGLSEATTLAKSLAGSELHVPPRQAMEMAGLEVEPYEGDDVVLVSAGLMTLDAVLNPPEPEPLPLPLPLPAVPPPGEEELPPGLPASRTPAAGKPTPPEPLPPPAMKAARAASAKRRWNAIIAKVQLPAEQAFMQAWRAWVLKEQQENLRLFDAVVAEQHLKFWQPLNKALKAEAFLPDLEAYRKRLQRRVNPVYAQELAGVYEYTVAELAGMAVFALDDPMIQAAITRREKFLVGKAPASLQKMLRTSLSKGLDANESMAELRARVSQAYQYAASSAKTLQVARTESAGFMNEAREAMFTAQGFERGEWLSAVDEHSRVNHLLYGGAGPQKRGFNYLTLSGNVDAGELKYPNDMDCTDAGEVVNCRCVMIPV